MKAIYKPKGKAGEYAEWACNFYVGCSNGCEYCYLKKGRGAKVLGGDKPILKKCFKNEDHALEVFRCEMLQNVYELRDNGLFFSFTTDPMLEETRGLTLLAMNSLVTNGIPIKVLTKCAEWVDVFLSANNPFVCDNKAVGKHKIAFGFTLTGHDELEPNASTNANRIKAIRKLHDAGFKTFSSIEPVIDFESSLKVIYASCDCCDLYKVGLESGKKYDKKDLQDFIRQVYYTRENYKGALQSGEEIKVYFKDGLLKQAGINREDLPENCVDRNYNIFQI